MAEIDIVLDGEKMQLMPSLNAATKLCDKYGGLLVIADLINVGQINVASDVVWYGLSGDDMDRKEIARKVYNTGLSKLAKPLVRYVFLLMNGGREITLEKDASEAAARIATEQERQLERANHV
jgi:hypothetical protein